MKTKIKYGIYFIPFLVQILVEAIIKVGELDESRSQLYVPLLAVFPFLYLFQGTLLSKFGGSLILAGVMTSVIYLSATGVFLNFISVNALYMINIVTFCLMLVLNLIYHFKQKH